MSGKLRAAYTKRDESYPGYMNVTEDESGVTLTVRGDPKIRSDGTFVCGHEQDRGKPGRCVPGDGNCNNYCNHDPNQPMPDRPKGTTQVFEGPTVSIHLTKMEWAMIARQLKL